MNINMHNRTAREQYSTVLAKRDMTSIVFLETFCMIK